MRSNETTNSGRASMSKASAPINVGGDCESDAAHLLRRDTERAVIATMMARANAVPIVRARLQPSDFYFATHRMMFGAASRLDDRGAPVDYVSVCSELERLGDLAVCGRHRGVAIVFDVLPLEVSLGTCIEIVLEAAVRRRWWRFAMRLLDRVRDPNLDLGCLEAYAVNELRTLLPVSEGARRAS